MTQQEFFIPSVNFKHREYSSSNRVEFCKALDPITNYALKIHDDHII